MQPPVTQASAAVPRSRPRRSGRAVVVRPVTATNAQVSAIATAQIGRLTRKIDRQPAQATSAPPAAGPAAIPIAPMPPHTSSACARARRSGN
jgi:hypothetical protein